jgi:hypothetical protein
VRNSSATDAAVSEKDIKTNLNLGTKFQVSESKARTEAPRTQQCRKRTLRLRHSNATLLTVPKKEY